MTKGYWIARVDVSNAEAYKAYVAANAEALNKYGGCFLVRGGRFEKVEGQARQRNVVVEFPSFESALACWESEEYTKAKALRDGHATVDIIVVEGYDGPPP